MHCLLSKNKEKKSQSARSIKYTSIFMQWQWLYLDLLCEIGLYLIIVIKIQDSEKGSFILSRINFHKILTLI